MFILDPTGQAKFEPVLHRPKTMGNKETVFDFEAILMGNLGPKLKLHMCQLNLD